MFLFEVGFRVARKAGLFGADYGDVFSLEFMSEGGYLIPDKNLQVNNGLGGKVRWINNSKGFRNEKEFNYEKPDNTIRILSIGDSFTSGYRVDQRETYSFLLGQYLNQAQDTVTYEVMVANVSNPLTGLEYLNTHGLKYKPDIVILGITLGNDLSECFIHLSNSGKKRLTANGVTDNPRYDAEKQTELMDEVLPSYAYDPIPKWRIYWDKLILPKMIKAAASTTYTGESIFAMKGKSPIYIHDFTHGLGIFLKKPPPAVNGMYDALKKTLAVYDELSSAKGFELKIALFPQRYQVNPLDTKAVVKDYALNDDEFDWGIPNLRINEFCKETGLKSIDLLPYFQKQSKVMYLPNRDMHWNPTGHQTAAKALFEAFTNE